MKKPLLLYQVSGFAVSSLVQSLCIYSLFLLTSIISFTTEARSQNLPSGFSQVLVASGISNPTVMAFAPDGRIFVAQQNGQLRVIKNGSLLPQPFVSLSVHSSGERGLLGIAFDPNFNSNRYIYLYYTVSSGDYNRISRFTANGDIAQSGSEQVVLNLDPLSSATNHNGGNMQFGPDGKLYVGVGENADAVNAQMLDTYFGKLLRINSDGSVPSGNPYTSGSNQRQRVWAHGLRNPYTLAFQPGTGKLFVNDVGGNDWEEINDVTAGGKNFGWPYAEGDGSDYSDPIYAYPHGSSVGSGCAITGGSFFNPSSTNYPSAYTGRYFYLDYCGNWIDMLTINGTSATRSNFASNIAGSPLSLVTGPDGNLYFLSRDNSAVYKIVYTGSSSAPVITNQPQSISVSQGHNAGFNVSATGTAPLTYQWRKNGTNISGASGASYSISSVEASDAGTYSVVVNNAAGSVTSANATLTVTSPNQPPTAAISSPVAGTTYAGGNIINFSGTATDPENGNLSASAYNWYVLFYHDTHNHPGPSVNANGSSGSFTIPTSGETASNVFYRLFLVVTDQQGAKDTTHRDILPRTSAITINTNPQGLDITLDGQPHTAPLIITSVEGVMRSIGVPSPQSANGSSYRFSNWSNGGAQTQTIATPVNNTTYTANFTLVNTAAPVITSQPQNVTPVQGNNASFSVTATGSAPLSYQWRRNGANISGANSSGYTIASVTTADAGTYSVVVSNSSGTVTSGNATLTVTSTGDDSITLFDDTEFPSSANSNDGTGITLGLKFRSTQNGFITGVRYYKGANTTGTRTGQLWSRDGTLMASVTFTNETASGWQQAMFSNPVAIQAGLTYIASYHNPAGYFASTGSYFTQAKLSGPLRGLANGEDGVNGLYRYSSSVAFPNNGYQSNNYWVDVVFSPGTPADITAPTVISVSPVNAAAGISINTTITANFSESINGQSVNATNCQLKAGNTIIGATINVTSANIVLTPASALSNSTVYTVLLKAGSQGIKDLAGNPLVNDYSWTFTTEAGSSGNIYTIFKSTDKPQEPYVNDEQGMGIVLGTKFRSTQNGFITGIRYYKGAGTTGTHTGSLWNSSGTQLATATFSSETASGWQQVLFSNPVSIVAGVTYIASCFSSSGDYAATDPYFTQAVVNGPLRGLANGEDGPNGLYKYSSTPVLPNNSYNASNYWIDVVFTPASTTESRPTQQGSTVAVQKSTEIESAEVLEVNIMPNPSHSFFNLVIKGNNKKPVTVRVLDMTGQIIEKYEKITINNMMRIGEKWRGGSYIVEVIQGGQRKFLKIIKVN